MKRLQDMNLNWVCAQIALLWFFAAAISDGPARYVAIAAGLFSIWSVFA